MNAEPVYNLFLFVANGVIVELGASVHALEGCDADKLKQLQDLVGEDHLRCHRYPVPDQFAMSVNGAIVFGRFRYASWRQLPLDKQVLLLEQMFEELRAPRNPLMVITPIVDGTPRVEFTTDRVPTAFPPELAN